MYFQKRTLYMSVRPLKPDVSILLSTRAQWRWVPTWAWRRPTRARWRQLPVLARRRPPLARRRYQPQRAVVASHGCAVDTNREYAES